jgi:hypothetical protein
MLVIAPSLKGDAAAQNKRWDEPQKSDLINLILLFRIISVQTKPYLGTASRANEFVFHYKQM